METYLDWPVVTAENVFRVVRKLGIKPWEEQAPAMPLPGWLGATKREEWFHRGYGKFCQNDVKSFISPKAPHEVSTFFRTAFRPWVTVFTLIPDAESGKQYVLLTAEWKQGNELITLVPPSGTGNEVEQRIRPIAKGMLATGRREVLEETGMRLRHIELLGSREGYYDQVRNADLRFFPAVACVESSLTREPAKLDDNEILKVVLMEVHEWLIYLENYNVEKGFGVESCAAITTYMALRRLGCLRLESL